MRLFIEPALKALQWLDTYAVALGHGFDAYQTRSPQGTRHQAWKDSSDALVYADGSDVEPPIATCEEQGFVYLAKLHLSEVLWWLDDKEAAKRLYHEASELKKRFNDAFWMEDGGFCAMGLDSQQRKITSIGSNPGHCLATAIADKAMVQHTADRLFAPDLFSGWGVRTLSAQHPAFNPYSYHRGSVWPVEQATFAIGFMRYGLHDHVEKICRAQFEAASLFDTYRLPELFSGHARDANHPFPSHYPGANAPQAWSASASFLMLQAMLAYTPTRRCTCCSLIRTCPRGCLRSRCAICASPKRRRRFDFSERKMARATTTCWSIDVLEHRGPLHILRQPSPWSLTATFAERLVDALKSLLPGKLSQQPPSGHRGRPSPMAGRVCDRVDGEHVGAEAGHAFVPCFVFLPDVTRYSARKQKHGHDGRRPNRLPHEFFRGAPDAVREALLPRGDPPPHRGPEVRIGSRRDLPLVQ